MPAVDNRIPNWLSLQKQHHMASIDDVLRNQPSGQPQDFRALVADGRHALGKGLPRGNRSRQRRHPDQADRRLQMLQGDGQARLGGVGRAQPDLVDVEAQAVCLFQELDHGSDIGAGVKPQAGLVTDAGHVDPAALCLERFGLLADELAQPDPIHPLDQLHPGTHQQVEQQTALDLLVARAAHFAQDQMAVQPQSGARGSQLAAVVGLQFIMEEAWVWVYPFMQV